MKPVHDAYEDIAPAYIRLIKSDSLEAALAIEQIHISFGGRAAVQAALVITVLKMSVQGNDQIPDLDLYHDINKDYPEAIPLLHRAVTYSCLAWKVVDPTLIYLQHDPVLRAAPAAGSESDVFGADLPN